MEYRCLGRTGIRVSPICLGTGNFGNPTTEEEAIRILRLALDGGINCVDTADTYANGEAERIIGRALEETGLRDQVIVATKVHYRMGPGPNDEGNSRLHIIKACESSLRRLRTDYVDLYLIHRPCFDIPTDETLGALTNLVQQGKIRYVGCSTHPAWKVMEAIMISEFKNYARYVVEQPPFNLLDRRIENELIPLCRTNGLGILAWAPMAMGMLAGRYTDGYHYPPDSRAGRGEAEYQGRVTPRAIHVSKQFVNLAREHQIPPGQLAVLWVTQQEGVTAAICGPRTIGHLEHVLPVLQMHLDDAVRAACDELVAPGSAVADFHNTSGWMKMKIE